MLFYYRIFTIITIFAGLYCTPINLSNQKIQTTAVSENIIGLSIEDHVVVASTVSTIDFSINTDESWSLKVNNPWIIPVVKNGEKGISNVVLIVQNNKVLSNREGAVSIISGNSERTIKITQTTNLFEASQKIIHLNRTQLSTTINISGVANWQAEKTVGWFSLSKSSGILKDNDTIQVNVSSPNLSVSPRIGKIFFKVNSQIIEVTIEQEGATLNLSSDNIDVGAISPAPIPFTISGDTDWTLSNVYDWVEIQDSEGQKITSQTHNLAGTQNLKLVVTSSNDTGFNRSATFIFQYANASKVLRVQQIGGVFNVSTENIAVPAIGGTFNISVSGVSDNWKLTKKLDDSGNVLCTNNRTNCQWYRFKLASNINGEDIDTGSFDTQGIYHLKLIVDANMLAEEQVSTIRFVNGDSDKVITITQSRCVLDLSSTTITLSAANNITNSLTLYGDAKWIVSKPATDTWYSISETSGNLSVTTNLTLRSEQSNTTGKNRNSILTFKVLNSTITKTVYIVQSTNDFTISTNSISTSSIIGSTYTFNIYGLGASWNISKPAADTWYSFSKTSGVVSGMDTITITVTNVNVSVIPKRSSSFTIISGSIIKTIPIHQSLLNFNVKNISAYAFSTSLAGEVVDIQLSGEANWIISKPAADTWYVPSATSGIIKGNGLVSIYTTSHNTTGVELQSTFTISSGTLSYKIKLVYPAHVISVYNPIHGNISGHAFGAITISGDPNNPVRITIEGHASNVNLAFPIGYWNYRGLNDWCCNSNVNNLNFSGKFTIELTIKATPEWNSTWQKTAGVDLKIWYPDDRATATGKRTTASMGTLDYVPIYHER